MWLLSLTWVRVCLFACAVPVITGVEPSEGPVVGGNTVTVVGTQLVAAGAGVGDVSVTVSGVAVSAVESVSATQIVVRLGDASGAAGAVIGAAGAASVRSAAAGSATLAAAYTYEASGVLASVVPAQGPLNGSVAVTLTGTFGADATTVQFGGLNGTIETRSGVAGSNGTSVLVVRPPAVTTGPQTVSVTVQSPTVGETAKAAAFTYNLRTCS